MLVIYVMIKLTTDGKIKPYVRPMASLQAIPETIGQAAELNRPVHISTGVGQLTTSVAPMTVAGMAVLRRVCEICGELGVKVQYFSTNAYMIPPMQDMIKAGYEKANRPEMYDESMVQFVGGQRAFMASVMGYFGREKPAANIVAGATYYETYVLFGVGAVTEGCVQIGGTPRLYYQGTIAALSDYPFLGQELFAAAAAITEKAPDIGSLRGQDLAVFMCLAGLLLTSVLTMLGSTIWTGLLTW
jgi:hypothetical protein